MTRRPPQLALSLLLALAAAPARADDDSRNARSTIRPPSRPGNAERLERSERRRTRPSLWEDLKEEIEEIWGGRVLRRGTTAVYVVDADTGQELYAVHEDEKLNPASNVKLISTASVLHALGPDWRFKTRVYGPSPGKDGTSRGDVYLLGQADPTLGPKRLEHLARRVALTGVTRIDGDVVISADLLRDTIGLPRIKVTVTGAPEAGEPPEVELYPDSDFLSVDLKAKTRRRRRGRRLRVRSRVETTSEGQPRQVIRVTGTIREGRTRRLYRGAKKRSSFTAHTLRAALIEAGVEVTGGVRIATFDDYAAAAAEDGFLPVVLAETRSRPISYLVRRTNKRSVNFLADRLVIAAGAQALGGEPSMKKGVALMHRWLARAGIDTDELYLDTGSGLSYETELTSHQIVKVLRTAAGYVERPEIRTHPRVFRASLAVGGEDGTLRSRFRGSPARGKVIGKTGTLTRIIALSGFLTAGERTLCFSLVTNDHRGGLRWSVRRTHERLVEEMFDFLRAEARLAKKRNAAHAGAESAGGDGEVAADAD